MAGDEKLDAVNKIIGMYLAGDTASAKETAMEAADKYLVDDSKANDPAVMVLDYLSGNATITVKLLAVGTEKTPGLWALASIAMFVRKVSEGNSDAFELENNLQNYLTNFPKIKSAEIKKWKPQVELWEKWCKGEFAPVKGLEPLFMKKCRSGEAVLAGNINDISLEDFEKSRAAFAKRPKPNGMDFDRDVMVKYRESLKFENLQRAEVRRYNYIKDMKEYLVRIFERNPYSGRIQLRRSTVNGTVSMANHNVFLIRSQGKKKSKSYKWQELKFDQYIEFFKYFANQRINKVAGNITKEQRYHDAAVDYLHLAVLCDWFGRYEEALTYARKAIKLDPSIYDLANKMMMGN
jgi:tetratricopeptide (TPR) repeat protein